MATAYPDEPPPAAGRAPGSAALQDQRLRLDDILKLMVADGMILPADAERIGRTRTQRFEHPLELVAEQRLKSLAPPHKTLALEPLVEWLARKLDVPYRHIDPLKV
jgi:general secretion pathway protein E